VSKTGNSSGRFQTDSERIFCEICESQLYQVDVLPTRDAEGIRTADFRITAGGKSFIAEIEELRPNNEELQCIRNWNEGRRTGSGHIIGARARNHIREAADQLKAHSSDNLPLVIVLYNSIRRHGGNFFTPMRHLEAHDIDGAMYGDMVVEVALMNTVATSPDRNGGKRTLTQTEKVYISAVAVISDLDDRTMLIYHNYFATVPLPQDFFIGPDFDHFEKPESPFTTPWQWRKRESSSLQS
jgi:hypothetical protein